MLENPKTTPILLIVVAVLLAGLFALNVISFRDSQAQSATRQLQALEILDRMEAQDELIFSLYDSYQDDAYGPSVERIAEQQLIATEYQLVALQALGLQNQQIAELLLLDYLDTPSEFMQEASDE